MKADNLLVFRVDASTQMGTGHVMRCLALAQAWNTTGGVCHFCTNEQFPVALADRLETESIVRVELKSAPGSLADAIETIMHCQEYDAKWLVLDGYHFDAAYQREVKSSNLTLLVLDDYGHTDHYYADLVLNQNAYAHAGFYPRIETYTKLLLGCKYALLRREFWPWRGNIDLIKRNSLNSPSKILVTLGGSDPNNVTSKVLESLRSFDQQQIKVNLIVGGGNPHLEILHAMCNDLDDLVNVHSNVSDMSNLISQADLAISAGGSTCWELAFMGVPSLLIILADNQRLNVEKLSSLNVAFNLGQHEKLSSQTITSNILNLLKDPDLISEMRQKSLKLVDGYGSSRVIDCIK
jgi:UDP-2,4-diacetamido-2,4,6-trideoxy-beta-L-altropyranose hydrolase